MDVYSMPEKIRNGVFIIPISLIVSLVIGITYSLLNFYIPIFGITTILFMGGFVALNVYLIYICAKYTKCTSRHYLLFCGLLAGLFGLYSSWVTFEACLLLDDYGNSISVLWLINPINLIDGMSIINKDGWTSYLSESLAPSGVLLWAMWCMEALILVFGTSIFVWICLDDEVLCENCGDWKKIYSDIHIIEYTEEVNWSSLTEKELSKINLLKNDENEYFEEYISLDTWECPRCNGKTIKFNHVIEEIDEKGKTNLNKNDITERLKITNKSYNKIFE